MNTSRPLVRLVLLAAFAAGAAQPGEPGVKTKKSAIEHWKKGEKALAAGEYDKAEVELKAAVADDPLQAPAFLALGQTQMATKRYAEALETFQKCKAVLHETLAERMRDEAQAGHKREDQILSLKEYLGGIQSGQVRTDNLQREVAQTEHQIRQLEDARQRGVVGSDPVPPVLWLSLGSAHFRLGHRDEAQAAFERAVRGDPRLGEAHNNLAVLHMMAGRLAAAETELAAAEQAGFPVSPKFKQDLASRRAKTP